MFGKLMNRYFYGKSGQGDFEKEDLPQNRWQLFWEMLRVRFSALLRLNLMYVVVWIPAIFFIGRFLMYGYSGLVSLSDFQAQLEAGGQQEGQGIRHRLRPDKTRLMEDRAEDEHRRNVDQPLTEDIENLSRKETATISRYFGRKLALWTIPCYRLT